MISSLWIEAIKNWAARTPEVEQVYLYGSRVTGSAIEESDLDIAVIMTAGEASQRLSLWIENASEWERQLANLIPVAVDLEVGDSDLSPDIVAPAVREHGVKVYDKAQTTLIASG